MTQFLLILKPKNVNAKHMKGWLSH